MSSEIQARELRHHEAVYSGFAQHHFARPGVRAFRRHLASRILKEVAATRSTRVLSLGCGIGDTELLLAPYVAHVTGIDLSPAAIRQAQQDAARGGQTNTTFLEGTPDSLDFLPGSFDAILAVFLLHHLPEEELARLCRTVKTLLAPGGIFYSLDPSRYRLSGAIGRILVPNLMKRHQTPDERELRPKALRAQFRREGFVAHTRMYDFLSTPLAGIVPGSSRLYRVARLADEALIRMPLLGRLGSNFELIAR